MGFCFHDRSKIHRFYKRPLCTDIEHIKGWSVRYSQLFDIIPEDAMATLTILRGNVDIINHQGNTVKLGGQTIVSLPFVLHRDMSHYN